MDSFDILKKLCEADGVSGEEKSSADAAYEILKPLAQNAVVDEFFNLTAEIKSKRENAKKIILDAHLDQVGFIVTYVTDDGFLKFSPVGGIDKRILSAQRVKVHTKSGALDGVITSVPPHLGGEGEKAPDFDDLFIDIGLDGDKAKRAVPLGTRVTYAEGMCRLLGDIVMSRSLDDRVGAAVILKALELVKDKSAYDICVSLCCCEETGEDGAKMTAYRANADLGIAVDVSFAHSRGEEKEKCGEMCKGAMIGIAPSLSRRLSDKLICCAEKNNIPYQREVMNGTTGTNADVMGITRGGVKTVTLSVPIRYMHTPVEVVSLKDLDLSAELLACFLKEAE